MTNLLSISIIAANTFLFNINKEGSYYFYYSTNLNNKNWEFICKWDTCIYGSKFECYDPSNVPKFFKLIEVK